MRRSKCNTAALGIGLVIAAFSAVAVAAADNSYPSLLAEVNDKRIESMESLESVYALYGLHGMSFEIRDGETWCAEYVVVYEGWLTADRARLRSCWLDLSEDNPYNAGKTPPRHIARVSEYDALVTPDAQTQRARRDGEEVVYLDGRNSVDERRAALIRVQDWPLMGGAYHGFLGSFDTPGELRPYIQKRDIMDPFTVVRNDAVYTVATFPDDTKEAPEGWTQYDGARGFLVLSRRFGNAAWGGDLATKEDRLEAYEAEPKEFAPGKWLPVRATSWRRNAQEKSVSRIEVYECRINEPIDEAVFQVASVGFDDMAVPAGFPGEQKRVYEPPAVTIVDFGGDIEGSGSTLDTTLAAKREEVIARLDGSWVSPTASDDGAAMRWALVLASAFLIVGVVVWRVRAA